MRPRNTLLVAGLALLLSGSLSASVASAQPQNDADKNYGDGLALFSAKKYDEAAVALEASYNAKPEQKTLFAWAQALRLSGKCDESRDLFAKYVANGANEKQTRAAYKLMADCKPAAGNPTDASTDGTDTTDTTSVTTTGDASNTTNSGSTGSDDPDSSTQLGMTTGGGVQDPAVDGPKPWYKDWIALSLLSAGVVSFGVSGISYANAVSLENEGMEPGTTYEEFLSLKSQSDDDRTLAMIFGGGGALCIGAGLAYIMLRDPSGGKETDQSFALNVDGNSAGFAFSGSF